MVSRLSIRKAKECYEDTSFKKPLYFTFCFRACEANLQCVDVDCLEMQMICMQPPL